MKQLALTFALIFALCFSGFAQDVKQNTAKQKQTPEQRAETESVRAAKKLTLNEKQKAIYKQFALQKISANKVIRQKLKTTTDAVTKESLNKEIAANRDKFRTNDNAMLNPEQQAKWAELNRQRDQRATTNK